MLTNRHDMKLDLKKNEKENSDNYGEIVHSSVELSASQLENYHIKFLKVE